MAVISPLDDLRGHVFDGSAERVSPAFSVLGLKLARKAEIGDDDMSVSIQKDILQFDVAVDYAALKETNS